MAKVLLVEDDNNLREIYQARLMAEGYDIVAAQNGEEALVVAKQNRPDLIISDVMMPRISGFEMLDILRNTDALKSTKVIMLTALGQAEDQKRADGLGADRYLVKSQVTLEDIVNAAKELLSESGAIADVPAAPATADPLNMPEPTAAPATPTTTGPMAVAVEPMTDSVAVAAPGPEPAAAPALSTMPDPFAATNDSSVASDVAATPTMPDPGTPPAPPLNMPTPPAFAPVPEPVVSSAPIAPAEPPVPAEPVVPVISMPTGSESPVPVAAPVPAEPIADLTASASMAVSDAATQTTEAEEAAVKAQIESYSQAPAEAPATVDPTEVTTDASNSETIASAVEELNATTSPEPLQPPSVVNAPVAPVIQPVATPATMPEPVAQVTPAAPAASSSDNNVTVAGKKIIQPISDQANKPNLDALLAKEEASQPAPPAVPVISGVPAAAEAPAANEPAHLPGQAFDPTKAL